MGSVAAWPRQIAWLMMVLWLVPLRAEIRLSDDTGHTLELARPAQRIVSLAPHVTELLFAAGAGAAVVGVVSYSDYPPAAKDLPVVGGGQTLNLEAILALRPDLIVAWQTGNRAAQLEQLLALGLPVYFSEPRSLEDIPLNIEKLGVLAGHEVEARAAAADFRAEHARLKARYKDVNPVRVFYQIWHQPLITVSGDHLISDVIRLCGGVNVFAGLPGLAPQVSKEAVLARNPEVIIGSGMVNDRPEWLRQWESWPQLDAVDGGHLYVIDADLMQRHTPRILQGARSLCEYLDRVR